MAIQPIESEPTDRILRFSFCPRPRAYDLPDTYRWEEQLNRYCPKDLDPHDLTHEYGYVFCHRGLYDRGLGINDNSESAIANGISQGFFLHELDAFVREKLDQTFLAHDHSAHRVTLLNGNWEMYSFPDIVRQPVGTRAIEAAEPKHIAAQSSVPSCEVPESDGSPSWSTAFDSSGDLVLSLLDVLLVQDRDRLGSTIQIDLREKDFARMIAYCCFHLTKFPKHQQSLTQRLFQRVFLKGYNIHYKKFDLLETAVKDQYQESFPGHILHTNWLRQLPPLIIVFYSDELIVYDRQMESDPRHDTPEWQETRFNKLYQRFLSQVSTFVRGDEEDGYNIILEIAHSGLGLGYDIETGDARSPIDRTPLCGDMVRESRVDRAMIDVSLFLRKEHGEKLLFSSCTRLPDVIMPDGRKFKAKFDTGDLEKWEDGQEGLPTRLRAIHGGLYPQSHLVVADNPAAEIAARTWIDEELHLDREKLLRRPGEEWVCYQDWLREGNDDKRDLVQVMDQVNDKLLPNQVELGDVQQPRTEERQNSPSPGDQDTPPKTLGIHAEIGSVKDEDLDALTHAFVGTKLYWAAKTNNINELESALTSGFVSQLNGIAGYYGSPLAVACAKGHYNIVRRLLQEKSTNPDKPCLRGTPLMLACERQNAHGIVQLLLERKANPNQQSLGTRESPLTLACNRGDLKLVEMLLEKGAETNLEEYLRWARTDFGKGIIKKRWPNAMEVAESDLSPPCPPLTLAAAYGDDRIGFKIVKQLLRRCRCSEKCRWSRGNMPGRFVYSLKIHAPGGVRDTALGTACYKKHLKTTKLLLKHLSHGALVSHREFYWACKGGSADIVQVLLDKIGSGARQYAMGRHLLTFSPEIQKLLKRASCPRSDELIFYKLELDDTANTPDTYGKKHNSFGEPKEIIQIPPRCGCVICDIDIANLPHSNDFNELFNNYTKLRRRFAFPDSPARVLVPGRAGKEAEAQRKTPIFK